jgi:hypothetical protein
VDLSTVPIQLPVVAKLMDLAKIKVIEGGVKNHL